MTSSPYIDEFTNRIKRLRELHGIHTVAVALTGFDDNTLVDFPTTFTARVMSARLDKAFGPDTEIEKDN